MERNSYCMRGKRKGRASCMLANSDCMQNALVKITLWAEEKVLIQL